MRPSDRVASLAPVLVSLVLASCIWKGVLKQSTQIGWGGRATAIAVDPTNDALLWVASPTGGIFESGVAGQAWGHIDALPEYGAYSIKVAPSSARTIVATFIESTRNANTGGVWLSSDGAKTWTQPSSAIARDASGSPRRYSAYGISFQPHSRNVYVGTDSGFVVSHDLGQTWAFINPDPAGAKNAIFSILALGNSRVLTYGSEGVWISENGQTKWYHPTNSFVEQWQIPNALAVSPLNDDHIFFANAYNSLFYSTNGGHDWRSIPAVFPGYANSRQVYVKIVKSLSGNANELDLYYAQMSTVERKTISWNGTDFDFSKSWQVLPFLHSDPGDLAFAHDGITPLYAGNDGGVEMSTDSGTTWKKAGDANIGYDGLQIYDVRAVLALSNYASNDLYFGTQDVNIYASGDDGNTWPDFALPEGGHFQAPITKAVPQYAVSNYNDQGFQHGDPLLVNVKYDAFPFPAPDAVYWIRDSLFAAFADDPAGGVGLFSSSDGCKTWALAPIVTIPQTILKYAVVTGPTSNPSIVVPFQAAGNLGLLRIDNAFNGVANDEVVTSIPLPTGAAMGTYGFQWRSNIVSFGVDPADPNFLIVPDVAHDVFYATSDAGNTWTSWNGLTSLVTGYGTYAFHLTGSQRRTWELADVQVSAIAFNPRNPNEILVGTAESGVFFSHDHGSRWGKVQGSERVPNVTGFAFDQTKLPEKAFASSWGRGLWVISLELAPRQSASLLPSFQRPTPQLHDSTVPGNRERARALYVDTLSATLLIEDSRTKTASGVVPMGRDIRVTGKHWLPAGSYHFELDGREIRLSKLAAIEGGTFEAILPAFGAPGHHVLRATQMGADGQRREATLEFNVAVLEGEKR